jgi:NAD(P)-dependent dehydrogenase (short-subunit alcohol dehydrogenase family)
VTVDRAAAIVTGGAGGLGAATVRQLVRTGMRVVVFDRDADLGRVVAKEVGPDAVSVGGDVNDDADVTTAIGAALALGRLSVVVNVAGGSGRGRRTVEGGGTPHEMSPFVKTMRVNAFGTFNVSRLTARAMSENRPDADGQRGVIVNTASVAGLEGQSGQIAYAAAKGAILAMTLPMARDLAPLGIRVCAIAPGPMATPAMTRVIDQLHEDPTKGIVFPTRMGQPDEFAHLVESIVGNPYLNGENIRLDAALRPGAT